MSATSKTAPFVKTKFATLKTDQLMSSGEQVVWWLYDQKIVGKDAYK